MSIPTPIMVEVDGTTFYQYPVNCQVCGDKIGTVNLSSTANTTQILQAISGYVCGKTTCQQTITIPVPIEQTLKEQIELLKQQIATLKADNKLK